MMRHKFSSHAMHMIVYPTCVLTSPGLSAAYSAWVSPQVYAYSIRLHYVIAEIAPVLEKLRLPGAGIRAATICRSWSTVVDCKSTPLERLKFWYRRHIRQLRRFRNRRFHNGHRGFHNGRPLRNRIQRCDFQWCWRVGLIAWPLWICWSGSVGLPCQLQEHVRT